MGITRTEDVWAKICSPASGIRPEDHLTAAILCVAQALEEIDRSIMAFVRTMREK